MNTNASGPVEPRCTTEHLNPETERIDHTPTPKIRQPVDIGKPRRAKQSSQDGTTEKLDRLLDQGITSEYFAKHDAPEINWTVDSVLESNATAMFYGDSGIGKTFLAMHLAYCIGAGKPWFDRPCKQSKTLYLDGENGRGLLHTRSRLIDVNGEADVTYYSFPDLALDVSGQLLLSRLIEANDADAVIIDPLMTFMEGDENSIEDIRPQIRGLRQIAESLDCALVLIHHENRSGGYRGSSGFKDLVTLQLHLKRSDTSVSDYPHVLDAIPTKQRQSTLERFTLAWKVVNGEFETACVSMMEGAPEQRLVEACQSLHADCGAWPGKDQLVKAKDRHGLSQNQARKALEAALGDNEIELNVGAHNKHEYRLVN